MWARWATDPPQTVATIAKQCAVAPTKLHLWVRERPLGPHRSPTVTGRHRTIRLLHRSRNSRRIMRDSRSVIAASRTGSSNPLNTCRCCVTPARAESRPAIKSTATNCANALREPQTPVRAHPIPLGYTLYRTPYKIPGRSFLQLFCDRLRTPLWMDTSKHCSLPFFVQSVYVILFVSFRRYAMCEKTG